METRLKGDFYSHLRILWVTKADWGFYGEGWFSTTEERKTKNTKIITAVREHLIDEKAVSNCRLTPVSQSVLACHFLVHLKVAYMRLIHDCNDASLISSLCHSIRWRVMLSEIASTSGSLKDWNSIRLHMLWILIIPSFKTDSIWIRVSAAIIQLNYKGSSVCIEGAQRW